MAQESWKLEQEETGCQHPEGPILCHNKCGFFGSAATMNLCSKCYRDRVLKQPSGLLGKVTAESPLVSEPGGKSLISAVIGDKITASSLQGDLSIPAADPILRTDQPQPPVTALDSSLNPDLVPGCSSSGVVQIIQDNQQSARRAPNRCFACRKRVGLTGFKCRCGDVFCASHRYSDKHNCLFDYKAAGRDAIAKANPVVKAEKIEKI